jgi:hypothetical protein
MITIQFVNGRAAGAFALIHRYFVCLVAFVVAMTTSVSAVAESAVNPATGDTDNPGWAHVANEGGFYTPLPMVNRTQLIALLRNYQEALAEREEEISRYLGESRMDAKDVLITVIMPGGLVYAAIRKANIEEAREQLSEITDDMTELSQDLLVMQSGAGGLKLAKLQ